MHLEEGRGSAPAAGTAAGDALAALRFLEASPRRWHQEEDEARFDAAAVRDAALSVRDRLRALADERDALDRRIRDLAPWGEFAMPDAARFPQARFWFYVVPHYRLRELPRTGLAWCVVNRDTRSNYVVAMAQDEPRDMPVPRVHAGAAPLAALRRRRAALLLEEDRLIDERGALARWCVLLRGHLGRLEDAAQVAAAAGALDTNGSLAVARGWAPVEALPLLRGYAREAQVAFRAEPPAPGDEPPVLLDPAPMALAGRPLVSFYLTPGYHTWDPSAVVLASFCVFFAMIVADAGYALLLAALLALRWDHLGATATGRWLRRVAPPACAATLAWGALCGSWLGLPPAPGSVPARLALLADADVATLMTLSVLLGIAHLAGANLARVLHATGPGAAAAALGWIALFAAGGLAVAVRLPGVAPGLASPAPLLAGVGALLVFLGSSRQRAPGARVLDGALALTRVVGAFGDSLSYLRLAALGYAGGALAGACNDLALQAAGGVGVLAGLAVAAGGHAINLVLGASGGVIHGLRLNCIEFFNWGIEREGRSFRPLRRSGDMRWANF